MMAPPAGHHAGIGNRPGFSVPQLLAFVQWQTFGFPFDLVRPADSFTDPGGQLVLAGLAQIVELAPGMGHAADSSNAVAEPGLVAGVVITDQLVLPVTHEGAGVFARPARR